MKGFCSVLLPPFANVSGQIVNRLPVLTPLCYGYIHTATGARLARKKRNCRVWGVAICPINHQGGVEHCRLSENNLLNRAPSKLADLSLLFAIHGITIVLFEKRGSCF